MVPLNSSQSHEHEGGLGFLIGEVLGEFDVGPCVCRRKKKKRGNALGEREREKDRVRE